MPSDQMSPQQQSDQEQSANLASILTTEPKKRHVGAVLTILALVVVGVAVYAYFVLIKKDGSIITEPGTSQPTITEQNNLSDEEKREQWIQSELDKMEKEDSAPKKLSEEEIQSELDKMEKEDIVNKSLTEEEREAILNKVQFEDADSNNI